MSGRGPYTVRICDFHDEKVHTRALQPMSKRWKSLSLDPIFKLTEVLAHSVWYYQKAFESQRHLP